MKIQEAAAERFGRPLGKTKNKGIDVSQ